MKSIQDIIDNQGSKAYRAERDRLKKVLLELVTAYRSSSTPVETLVAFLFHDYLLVFLRICHLDCSIGEFPNPSGASQKRFWGKIVPKSVFLGT